MTPQATANIEAGKLADKVIQNSFVMEPFDSEFLSELQAVVVDDVHLDTAEVAKRNWIAIHAYDSSGQLDTELEILLDWRFRESITTVFASSLKHITNSNEAGTLVMKLNNVTSPILAEISAGLWMFGEIPKLAQQRIEDWRADIWFSYPLKFIVLAEHDGYGMISIAGPAELIEKIKTETKHGLFEWRNGVVPSWNKGAEFPETTVPP